MPRKKITRPKKNTIRKIGKHIVTLSGSGPAKKLPRRGPLTLSESATILPARGPPLPDATYIDAPQLLARFGGRSHMWLVRLLERDQTFPRPVKIGRLRFFNVAALVKWERATAAKSRAA